MDILARAVIPPSSPSDVLIVPHAAGTMGAASADAEPPRRTIALARVNQPALTTWLQAAINLVLAGQAPTQPRPNGILIEHGRFTPEDTRVWACDWYGRGKRVAVACCGDSDAARDLAHRLNRLLGRTAVE